MDEVDDRVFDNIFADKKNIISHISTSRFAIITIIDGRLIRTKSS